MKVICFAEKKCEKRKKNVVLVIWSDMNIAGI